MSTDVQAPLSASDCLVLTKRRAFLGRMMNYLYVALSVVAAALLAKNVLASRTFEESAFLEPLEVSLAIGSVLVVIHIILSWYDRNLSAALLKDLSNGLKIRHTGTLVEVAESAESEPTYFSVSTTKAGKPIQFALRSLNDLRRIQPGPLLGQYVEVEYAPSSEIVLQLRALAEPSRSQ